MKHFFTLIFFLLISVVNVLSQFAPEKIIYDLGRKVNGISSMQKADIDSDGKIDIVAASENTNLIFWIKNLGDGNFSDIQIISYLAMNPEDIAVADINQDGFLDVVSASSDDNKIAWYPNNGSGDFGEQQVITSTLDQTIFISLVDMDNDDDLDIITANHFSDILLWYENEGNGQFNPIENIIATDIADVEKVIANDLDKDGDYDIVFTTSTNDRLSVIQNLGNNNFSNELEFVNFGQYNSDFLVQDIDEDGDDDIVTTKSTGVDLIILAIKNNGNGVFNSIDTLHHNANFATHLLFTDLTGEGENDIIIASGGELSWYINEGNLTFNNKHVIQLNIYPKGLVVFDVDGDDNLDIVLAKNDNQIVWYNQIQVVESTNYNNFVSNDAPKVSDFKQIDINNDGNMDVYASEQNGVAIYNNDGLGNFDKTIIETGQENLTNLNLGDFNNDNKHDLVTTSTTSYLQTTKLLLNNGSNEYPTARNLSNTIRQPDAIEFMDVNNDGKLDVISSSNGDRKVVWFEHDDILNNEPIHHRIPISHSKVLLSTDIDQDGDLDYICYLSNNEGIRLLKKENGSFVSSSVASTTSEFIQEMKAADIDGDNDLDIVVGAQYGLACYVNDGNENFNFIQLNTTYTNLTEIDVADIENDGDIDVVGYTNVFQNRKFISYLNDGAGNFNSTQTISSNFDRIEDLVLSDFDDDNLVDIAFTEYTGAVGWQRNLGSGLFGTEIQLSNHSADQIKSIDLDSDGDLDIVYSSHSNSIHWLENINGSFAPQVDLFLAANESFDFGDFDKDGHLDIVAQIYEEYHTIVWYMNDGEENFTTKNIISTQLNAPKVIVDDINNDGEMDVFTYTFNSGSYSGLGWIENLGNGKFNIDNVITEDAGYIHQTKYADIDSDGLKDIVLIKSFSQYSGFRNVSWLKNNGDGTFETDGSILLETFTLVNLDVADIDSDSDMDILIVKDNSSSNSLDDIFWLKNDGQQNFEVDTIQMGNYANCEQITIKDVNSDNKLDIIIASNDDYIVWLENIDNSEFSEPIKVSDILSDPNSLNVADINGDNHIDIIASSSTDGKIRWFQNNGEVILTSETIPQEIINEPINSNNITPHFIIDTSNNDSFKDIIFASNDFNNPPNYQFSTLTNTEHIQYEPSTLINGNNINLFENEIFYADVNMDGKKDIITTYSTSHNSYMINSIIWFENLGNNSYSNNGIVTEFDEHFDIKISGIVDLNGDGKIDILANIKNTNTDGINIVLIKQDETGVFDSFEILEDTDLPYVKSKASDFDNDGDIDIVAGIRFPSGQGSKFAYLAYQNNGDGTFTEGDPTILVNPTGFEDANNLKLDVADVDGNGTTEIFVAYQFEGPLICSHCPPLTVYLYSIYEYNSAQNKFNQIGQTSTLPFPNEYLRYDYAKPYLADVNLDGNIDILTTNYAYRDVYWLMGDGQGNFPDQLMVAENRSFLSLPIIKPADADNDGDIDVFVMTETTLNHRFEVYENLTNQPDADEDGFNVYTDCDDNNEFIGDTLIPPTLNSNTVLCEGDLFQFQLDTVITALNYTWSGPNSFSSNNPEPIINSVTIANSGQYDVQLNSQNCTSELASTNLDVNEYPIVQIIENESSLEAQGLSISSYQWYLDGVEINGADQMNYTFTTSGDYYVVVSNDAGCETISDTISIVISSVFNQQQINLFQLYPNPVLSNQTVQINLNDKATSSLDLKVLNIAGQLIFEDQINNSVYELKTNNLPKGMYTVQVINEDKMHAVRLIVID